MNKTIMITGATSGIGKATAELYAKKGFNLIITGRRTDRLESLKDSLEKISDCNVDVRARGLSAA